MTVRTKYKLYPDPAQPRPLGDQHEKSDLADVGAFDRALSIALAMKGGVSLAVWIGGAVAEVDVLRRVRISRDARRRIVAEFVADADLSAAELPFVLRRADHYATLLIAHGYDRVVLDVLAGASAGGLNAVLYGVAQRAGVAVDGLLKVWSDSGAAWRLLRAPGYLSVPSVLSGQFFWTQVMTAIETFYAQTTNELHSASEISVDLSATITDREYRSMPGSKEGRGHFHFVGTDLPIGGALVTGRNIPHTLDEVHARRIAYAARTTSSFPGAFEQAQIWSPTTTPAGRVRFPPRPADEPDATEPVDMTFAFSAHRHEAGNPVVTMPIRVMDGGILDNIPIDRLYRAVRDNNPRYYGDRIAIYLDPSPDGLPSPRLRPEESDPPRLGLRRAQRQTKQSFLDTVAAGLGMRGIRESENDEIAQLEDALLADRMSARRSVAYAQVVRGQTFDTARKNRLGVEYLGYRATTDSQLLQRVFGDPDLWQLTTDLVTRSRWDSTDPVQLRSFDYAFATAFASVPTAAAAIRGGSQGLRDATLCALDWMRALEKEIFATRVSPGPATAPNRDGLRNSIHLIGLVARKARDENSKHLLDRLRRATSGDEPPDLSPDRVVLEWIAAEAATSAALTNYWQLLETCLKLLRQYSADVPSFAGSSTPWASFPADWGTNDLAPFVASEGIPDPVSLMQYSHITAAQATELEAEFTPLREQQDADTVATWLRLPSERFRDEARASNLSKVLEPGSKLAGSTLGNFGAFFSRAWRTNDWWWGRLDAAAGLVSTLETLAPAPRRLKVPSTIAVYPDDVQRLILMQADHTPTGIRPYPERVSKTGELPLPGSSEEVQLSSKIAASMQAGAHSLAQLKPSYLVSVASRAAHLALRALRSGQGKVPKAALSVLAPPLLTLAPLAFAPIRIAFAATTLFAVIHLVEVTGGGHGTTGVTWEKLVPLAVAAVLWAAGVGQAIGRWARIARLGLTRKSGPFASLRGRAVSAIVTSAALLIVATAALGVAIIRSFSGTPFGAELIYLCVLAAALSLVGARASVRLDRGSHRSSTVAWTVLSVGMAVILFAPVGWVAQLVRLPDALLIGIAASIIFAALSYGWLGSLTDGRQRLLGLLWWVLISLVSGAGGGVVAGFVIIALGSKHALIGTPLGFAAGLATGLAAWFVAAHLGWWLSELVRTDKWVDVDTPKFSKRP